MCNYTSIKRVNAAMLIVTSKLIYMYTCRILSESFREVLSTFNALLVKVVHFAKRHILNYKGDPSGFFCFVFFVFLEMLELIAKATFEHPCRCIQCKTRDI